MSTNKIILEILSKKGITGDENIQEFLSPVPRLTYDPFLLFGMKEGVDLILSAIDDKKKICVYGDYDADGITSTSILLTVLRHIGTDVTYYIPSRFDEGYGLNMTAIDKLQGDGVELIVTVDCGVTGAKEIAYAREKGVEVLVTDHHNEGECFPDTDTIVIDPKQVSCNYPFEYLAGCGVAFKLAQALQREAGFEKAFLNNLLDLVAIGTIADVMPLIDENRTIVKYGINKILTGKRKGLDYLVKNLISNEINSENLAYYVIPSINAAGRMGSTDIAVRCLISDSEEEATEYAKKLIELNSQRKKIQESDYERCISLYESDYNDKLFPIVFLPNANEGICGIVAGKMKEYSQKPFAIVTESKADENIYKGTCRSMDGIDIFKILKKESAIFEKFGGHRSACGFSIKKENLELLKANVEKTMASYVSDDIALQEEPFIEITPEDIDEELVAQIELLEPFGNENEKPVFVIKNCRLSDIVYLGDEKKHMRTCIKNSKDNIDCIYFNIRADDKKAIEVSKNIDVTGTIGFNRWRGNKKIQVFISSIHLTVK